jgi:electron transfer flavoprotein alpha subunit
MKYYIDICSQETIEVKHDPAGWGWAHNVITTACIEAETEDKAIELARQMYPGLAIGHIETERYRNWVREEQAKDKEKEARRKARKAERDAEKMRELGLTAEEYKEYQKKKAKITRYKREVRQMKEQIAELEKQIAYKEKWLIENT